MHPTLVPSTMTDAARASVSSRALRSSALLLLVVYPVLLIVQGLDFTDMGFNLSNQWLLLRDPDSYRHGYLFYLSNLIGGFWLALAAPLGMFWIKFGWVLVLYLTLLMAYATLKDIAPGPVLLFGLALALLWNTKFAFTWIEYNSLTALFFTAGACLLRHGVAHDRRLALAGAGLVLGASVLLRLPNVAAAAFVLVVPFHAWIAGSGGRWAARRAALFVGAFVVGVAAVALVMAALGHLEPYVESLQARFAASAGSKEYPYTFGNLLSRLLSDYWSLALCALGGVPILLAARLCTSSRPREILVAAGLAGGVLALYWWKDSIADWWVLGGAAGAAAVYLHARARRGTAQPGPGLDWFFPAGVVLATAAAFALFLSFSHYAVTALLLVFLVHQLVRRRDSAWRLAAALALLALVITPLGSGNGVANAVFGSWLAMPLAFAAMFDALRARGPWHRTSAPVVFALIVSALALVGASVRIADLNAYRDDPDRTRMTASVDHPMLEGVLTTPERAQVVADLLYVLELHVRPGDPLLVHGGCSLVYLLTDTRPMLNTTWTGAYELRMFQRKLHELEQGGPPYPVVVTSSGSCRDRLWPVRQNIREDELVSLGVLQLFMKRRGYRLLWRNGFFQVWSSFHDEPSARDGPAPPAAGG